MKRQRKRDRQTEKPMHTSPHREIMFNSAHNSYRSAVWENQTYISNQLRPPNYLLMALSFSCCFSLFFQHSHLCPWGLHTVLSKATTSCQHLSVVSLMSVKPRNTNNTNQRETPDSLLLKSNKWLSFCSKSVKISLVSSCKWLGWIPCFAGI